jgi:hypothetical protein
VNTIARDIQLEALKRKRKSTRIAREYILPGERELALVDFIREIQRIAMGGIMPTMAVFNMTKPVTWPTALEFCQRFNLDWYDFAEEAGLRWKR